MDFKRQYRKLFGQDRWHRSVNNTSVHKYWKILYYPPNTDTGTFYGGSTDIDALQYVSNTGIQYFVWILQHTLI